MKDQDTDFHQNDSDIIEIRCGIVADCFRPPKSPSLMPNEADQSRLNYEAFVVNSMFEFSQLNDKVIEEYTHDSKNGDRESFHFAFKNELEINGNRIRLIVFYKTTERLRNVHAGSMESLSCDDMQQGEYGITDSDMIFGPIQIYSDDFNFLLKTRWQIRDIIKKFTSESIAKI